MCASAAALLVEQGHDVVGVTLKLYDATGTSAAVGRCCGPRDIADARATAAALGFPHYVLDESEAFAASVIDEFVAEHRVGRTPNPCVRCNEKLKFGPLLAFADAVQAAAWRALDLGGVDAATITAHKLGGPQGVGAVYVRRGLDLPPLVVGGHQEHERRAGTENVAGLAGFGVAARLAAAERAETVARVARLRDALEARLLEIPGARTHGDVTGRVPGTLNVAFAGAPGQLVSVALDLEGVCVATGAACTLDALPPGAAAIASTTSARTGTVAAWSR